MVPFMFDELSAIFKKLIGLIFKKDAIDNARSTASMLIEKWLQDSKNQLKLGLVDIGAQGSTNCAHGDERARREVFLCTKLRAHKSVKALLSSTWMLFKVASCFCV